MEYTEIQERSTFSVGDSVYYEAPDGKREKSLENGVVQAVNVVKATLPHHGVWHTVNFFGPLATMQVDENYLRHKA